MALFDAKYVRKVFVLKPSPFPVLCGPALAWPLPGSGGTAAAAFSPAQVQCGCNFSGREVGAEN